MTRELNRNAFASCAHTAMAINDRRAPTTTNERTNETSNSNEWREEKRTKKEKHTITLAEGKKTTHIAFINIIKSLCAAAILNSTVFFFYFSFYFILSFSLPVLLCHTIRYARSLCCCYSFFFYCITKATLPLLMFRIPMFFFPLFQSVSFFVLYFTTLPTTRDVCVQSDMLL